MIKDKSTSFVFGTYVPKEEPFYLNVQSNPTETELFMAAYSEQIPVILKGPTGCGKTRFLERMVYDINRSLKKGVDPVPLITVPCHEDLNADDLKGRPSLDGNFIEGAALASVTSGGILYLDEAVEARSDTTVIIHPLTDYRRTLTIERQGKMFVAPESFNLVISYNPGYQKKSKDLKQSTRQRFVAIEFDYPSIELETEIISHEANIDSIVAKGLAEVGLHVRNLKGKGLDEGSSTRLLVRAGQLIRRGIPPIAACYAAVLNPIIDNLGKESDIRRGLEEVVKNYFPK